ncbi:hypothetical protein [Roseinatronobacter monicus]|uniref:hypothetical protein n=1 Tax=Roseinatronobacter monicus TaxID=393481 RepID=UPI003F35DEDE
MLAAILGILHKAELDPATLAGSGIEDLHAVQLAQVLAARTAEDAVVLLHQISADTARTAPVTLEQVATSAVRDQVNINSSYFHLAEKPTLPKIKASRRRERTS